MTVEYQNPTAKVPLHQRVNLRILVFIAIIALLVGYPLYILISEQLSGGIHSSGGYIETNLKAMGNFEFDGTNGTVNDIPQKWRELDGKKLVLVGEMYAGNNASDEVHNFQLVYNIAKCCFSGPPRVQERVFCTVPNNGAVTFYGGYAKIKGTLHVEVKKDGGIVTSVYTLDVESAEPVS